MQLDSFVRKLRVTLSSESRVNIKFCQSKKTLTPEIAIPTVYIIANIIICATLPIWSIMDVTIISHHFIA